MSKSVPPSGERNQESSRLLPLSTSMPRREFHDDIWKVSIGSIKEKFAREISKQDAKLLFGDLGVYEDPSFKKFDVICEPGAEVNYGTACTVYFGGSCFLVGVVQTRRPDRSKTYRVHFLRDGRIAQRNIDCEEVFPIVAIRGYRVI